MLKLNMVVDNTKRPPDPEPPAGGAVVVPPNYTWAVGRSWPVVLGVMAPPEDDVWSYKDYRNDMVWQALAKIAEKRGVEVMVGDFEEFAEKRKETLLGVCLNNELVVLINELVPNWFKPMVLAHELAHFKLHANMDTAAYKNDVIYHTAIENEAHRFSKRLVRQIKHRLFPPVEREAAMKKIREREQKERDEHDKLLEKALDRSKHLMLHPEDASNEAELAFVHTIRRITQELTCAQELSIAA